jgi:hypothetical protein
VERVEVLSESPLQGQDSDPHGAVSAGVVGRPTSP